MGARGLNPGSAGPSGAALVYVVDDERIIAEVVQEILRHEGMEVEVFSDPAAALKAFANATRKPDMLVTDYVMKPLNGMDLMLRCRAINPNLRTLLYSGNVSGQITDLYAQKPNAFMEKPFQPAALVQTVRRLLNAPS